MQRFTIVAAMIITVAGCGESRPVAQPAVAQPVAQQVILPPATREVQRSIEGQLFLTSMLLDLDSFRGTAEFSAMGFGQGGKYHRWMDTMDTVKNRTDYPKFTRDERIAAGDLMGLGLRYALNRNQEEDYTRYARSEIKRVLGQ